MLCTRHGIYDTLVLIPGGHLEIITSSGRRIPLSIPKQLGDGHEEVARKLAFSLSMARDDDDNMSGCNADREIVDLLDPAGPRCSVRVKNGKQIRIFVDLNVRHNLVRRCLEALSCVLSPESFFIFKRELLVQINRMPAVQRRADHAIWDCFLVVVLGALGFPVPSLLRSPFDKLLTQARTSSSCIARRLAEGVRSSHASINEDSPTMGSHMICDERLKSSEAASILIALHLLAQDCRLSSSWQIELTRLASLLVEISGRIGRMDWQDYWIRLIPHVPLRAFEREDGNRHV